MTQAESSSDAEVPDAREMVEAGAPVTPPATVRKQECVDKEKGKGEWLFHGYYNKCLIVVFAVPEQEIHPPLHSLVLRT